MDDIVVKGIWAGFIGSLGDVFVHKLSYFILHTSTTSQYIASLVFHTKNLNDAQYLIGFLCHLAAGAFIGVFIALFFKYFGAKYAYIKGLGFSVAMWIVHIVVIPNIIPKIPPFVLRTLVETYVDLFAHLTFGFLTTTVLIKRFEKLKF